MDEKVNILMATYNGEKYLNEQIDSLLNQTYKNIQIIISDDCSKDSTKNILKQYEEQEPQKIKVFYQEKNLGYVKNFEFLLNYEKEQEDSSIYMLCDQDDVWKEEKVERSLEKLKEGNYDLVFGDIEVIDENLNTKLKSYNDFMHLTPRIKKYISSYKLQYLYNCMTGCTIISRKELLNKVLPFPKNSKYVIHDYWLGLIAEIYGKVGYLQTPYILYRQHGTNQVGIFKASYNYNTIYPVRDVNIKVKLGVFETYLQNERIFPKEIQDLNREAYNYFKMLQTKNKINFKGWKTFHKLYKTETLFLYLENFMTLNLPVILEPFYKIRYYRIKNKKLNY